MSTHQYTLQILDDGAQAVGAPQPVPDPRSRLVEALRWKCCCDGQRLDPGEVELQPVWDDRQGRPFVDLIEASVRGNGRKIGVPAAALFAAAARSASARMVRDELLEVGQSYGYRIAAHPAPGGDPAPYADVLDEYPVTDLTAPTPTPLAQPFDEEWAQPEDFEVRIPGAVISAAVRLAEQAGQNEAGGVLVGYLRRQPERSPQPFLEVTELIPAEEGNSTQASFQFTAATWSRARAQLEERGGGEVFVGWMHSHPDFCSKCPAEKQAVCTLRNPFFSEADVLLMEAVFPAAWSVGLLVTDAGEARIPALFGWRNGLVQRRAFHVTNPSTINQDT